MGVGTTAGTKLYIAAPGPLSPDPAWTEIKEIADLGTLGPGFTEVTFESIGDAVTRVRKGTKTFPVWNLTVNRDVNDPGQQMALQARDATGTDVENDFYNFKVERNDAAGSPSRASTYIFKGQVMTFNDVFGGVNSITQANLAIAVEPDTFTFTPNNG